VTHTHPHYGMIFKIAKYNPKWSNDNDASIREKSVNAREHAHAFTHAYNYTQYNTRTIYSVLFSTSNDPERESKNHKTCLSYAQCVRMCQRI